MPLRDGIPVAVGDARFNAASQSEKTGGFFGFRSRPPGSEKASITQLHELPGSNATGGQVQELDGTGHHELQ